MADNTTLNIGSGGDVIGSDDIAGVKFQRVKLIHGADGTNAGDVATGNPLPVTLKASTDTTEVVGDAAHDAAAAGNPLLLGAYASAAAPTNVSADADAVRLWALRNGALAVNVTAAGALVPGDATNGLDVDVTRVIPGTSATHLGKAVDSAVGSTDTGVAALVKRTDTLATLTPADGDYVRAQTNARGALWVALDSTAAQNVTLAAGSAAIGKLAANSGVDIGDVDVTSLPALPAGTNNIGSVTPAGTGYETVAASQTAQVLGATGATGDYIAGVLIVPATTSPGAVTLLDNATSITIFTGGTDSVSNLVPFFVPLGIKSVSGAWKLTTGANVSAIGMGTFT